jgi:hypothetical protein
MRPADRIEDDHADLAGRDVEDGGLADQAIAALDAAADREGQLLLLVLSGLAFAGVASCSSSSLSFVPTAAVIRLSSARRRSLLGAILAEHRRGFGVLSESAIRSLARLRTRRWWPALLEIRPRGVQRS